MFRRLLPVYAAAAVFAGGYSLLRPFGAIETGGTKQSILNGAQIDPGTLALFERACQNCHSSKTRLPIYGRVPPFSWLIARDVRHARSHMNLSRWQEYSDADRSRLLSEIGSAVRNRKMPLPRYLLLHPEARLSQREREQIYQWTRAERSRLRPQPTSTASRFAKYADSPRTTFVRCSELKAHQFICKDITEGQP
jgi:Haem-binding domain